MSSGPVGVGIIGAGVISKQYLDTFAQTADVEVKAIGDLVPEAARARAEEFGVAGHGGVEVVLDDPSIEIVVNLTIPVAHFDVAHAAVSAGKHVWNEKPLTMDRESAATLMSAADAAGLLVGCAPDTVLGPAWQSVRRAVDSGVIGTPLTGLVLFQSPGPEAWHPNPDFLFQTGGGPLLDIGPYYLSALAQIFGAVDRVASVGSQASASRTIGSGPRAGESFDVTVPTHVGGLLSYAGGGVAQAVFSFDSAVQRTVIEIAGSEGTLIAPDPNRFDGKYQIKRPRVDELEDGPETTSQATRGTGVVDMARAIRTGEKHRATGQLAAHVLDVMLALESGVDGSVQTIGTTAERPPAIPDGWDPLAATL